MIVGLVETFGMVPQSVFPESFNSSATGKVDTLITSKLREYAICSQEEGGTDGRSLPNSRNHPRSSSQVSTHSLSSASSLHSTDKNTLSQAHRFLRLGVLFERQEVSPSRSHSSLILQGSLPRRSLSTHLPHRRSSQQARSLHRRSIRKRCRPTTRHVSQHRHREAQGDRYQAPQG